MKLYQAEDLGSSHFLVEGRNPLIEFYIQYASFGWWFWFVILGNVVVENLSGKGLLMMMLSGFVVMLKKFPYPSIACKYLLNFYIIFIWISVGCLNILVWKFNLPSIWSGESFLVIRSTMNLWYWSCMHRLCGVICWDGLNGK